MTGYLSNVAAQNQNTDMNVQKCASIYLQIILTIQHYAPICEIHLKVKLRLCCWPLSPFSLRSTLQFPVKLCVISTIQK